MKIRTTKYIIKDGLLNAYRNKLMSLASVGIVTASLIIFGIFLLITINLNQNAKVLKQQIEMQVFCDPELDDAQVAQIEDTIKSDLNIDSYRMVSKKEAFEKVKEMLNEDKVLLDGEDESFLPISFTIKIKNPKESKTIFEQYKGVNGVEKVVYSQQYVEIISKVTYWIQMISIFLLIILLLFAMFIIANTIKLTVFARRREINIMKYIGATDWFIRWPFIIEGVIIGLIGAILSFIFIGYIYNYAINSELFNIGNGVIQYAETREIGVTIIITFSLIGAFIGALGSMISIRKYLHV